MSTVLPEHGYFRQASFLLSVPEVHLLPPDTGAEIAVVGRSNVGKSTVLNALCDQQGLARTSRTPGRTQQIVVFDLAQGRRLLDLPGFGYAAVRRTLREQWGETIPRVLNERRSLIGLLLLADARFPLKQEERDLLQWCVTERVRVQVVLNKTDKVNRQVAIQALRDVSTLLDASQLDTVPLLVSATAKSGIGELRGRLHAWYADSLKEGPGS